MLFRVRRATVAVLAAACLGPEASAQEGWAFATEIPCATAPVQGLPFSRCWVSNTRSFRIGDVRAWRFVFSDPRSEIAAGFYKLVTPRGSGGMTAVAPGGLVEWLRTAEALKNVTASASGWAVSGPYAIFQKPGRQCIGFVRNGPAATGEATWILGATLCRESPSMLPASEAQFISDALRVRD